MANLAPKVAYFSAEIGIDENIKTYSGGLGILAGDTIKAMADLGVPFCAVTLLYTRGFFKQKIDENYTQVEEDDPWDFKKYLKDTDKEVKVNVSGEDVTIHIWEYIYKGVKGSVPIYFLDTALDCNSQAAKDLTEHLYVGDRLGQELILGIGGLRALKVLHPQSIEKYHMNEGHSAFLTLELYKQIGKQNGWSDEFVKEKCVFTTHTPIPAGHDIFPYEEFFEKIKGEENLAPWHLRKMAGDKMLNTTQLALSYSDFHNAVSKKHKEVTKGMFPDTTITSITNGIHVPSWACDEMASIFDRYCKGWREDSTKLKEIFKVPTSEIYKAHRQAKKRVIEYVNSHDTVDVVLKENVLTIGFARRFIQYKDAELIFSNLDHLKKLGKKVQFIFSGKAHKNDGIAKTIMRRILTKANDLKEDISIAFIPDYSINVTKQLVAGCDLWLNTPIPPNEASGTSGMKAAVNGCLHFSRLDGWAIENFERNGGGFPITEYLDFITTLEYKIIPMFYSDNKCPWIEGMKLAIGNGGAYFNTHRMAKEYIEKAYKLKY